MTTTEREPPGKAAYEADCAEQPTYHNGHPRPAWEALPDYAKDSWHRNPAARYWPRARRTA